MSKRKTTERVVYTIAVDLPPGLSCTSMVKHLENAMTNYFDATLTTPEGKAALTNYKIRLLERHVLYR